ncbi:MAG: type II secretion system F family protein [Planctomycetes bacterium]|nr:type II secretion system F family protein [Planctomycetota bacterium]
MATFQYHAVFPHGASGSIDATDRAAAVRALLQRGVTPERVEPISNKSDHAPAALFSAPTMRIRRKAMSRSETATFVRELATAIQAGLPIVQAIRTIARQVRKRAQQDLLGAILHDVEHGHSLAEAFAARDGQFGELIVNMTRAGEASGRLGEVLTQAANLLDRDLKLRRAVLSATLYPMILGVLIFAAIVILVTVIVPGIIASVGPNIVLPLPTRIVVGTADIFSGYWWLIVAGVALVYYGARRWYAQPQTRIRVDAALLGTPVLGRLLRDVAVARFTRTLGTLTSAGVPVLSALQVTKGTLGNKAMEAVVDDVCVQVAAGRTIADPMEQSGYFPPMLVQIVNLGERTGRLDEMLDQAAGAFEDRTEMSLKLFTTALPPILVVMMACVVGFIVLSVLLPLMEMQDQIGG